MNLLGPIPPLHHTAPPPLPTPPIFSVLESVGAVNDYRTVGANDWRVGVGGGGGEGGGQWPQREVSCDAQRVAGRQHPVPEVTAPAPMGRRLPVLTRKGRNRK